MIVHRFLGFGWESNVYLIEDRHIAIIDTGTGFYNRKLVEEIEEYVNIEDIDYIILTHEHFDHCGGAKKLKELSDASIFIHEKGAEVLEKGEQWSSTLFNARQPVVKVEQKLKEGDRIYLGDAVLEVIYTPGHSEGSICLYERNTSSLFSGDTVFAHGGVGRTDFYGGNFIQLTKSIKKLLKLPVKNLYPGHGDYVIEDGYRHIEMASRLLEE